MSTGLKFQPGPEAIDDLWQAYWSGEDTVSRERLIECYRPLVEKLAGYHYARRIENDVEFEDFIQFGYTGLIESINRYESDSTAKFETFASYRIKGAILNGLTKMSEKREQIDYRNRIRRERVKSLSKQKSSSGEADLFDELVDVALGLAVGFMLEDAPCFAGPESSVSDCGYSSAQYSAMRTALISRIEALPHNEKLVVYYHYFQGLKFEEVASAIGLTKGRVSQLHRKALTALKESLFQNTSLDGYI